MKKYSLIFVFSSLVLSFCFAQNVTKENDDNFKLPASKQVELNLKFASSIQVSTWNRNELGLKTIITASSEELRKIHQMEVSEGSTLKIETDYDMEDRKNKKYNCWSCNEDRDKDCQCLEVSYEIMLPANAALSLETISGDIEIKDFKGITKAKTISGYVDFGLNTRASCDLSFKSVTGEIYTDFDLTLDKDSSPWSKKLNTSLNGGGDLISLETISGDIFFRKE